MGEKLAFWRDEQGKVSCHRDLCPHLGAKLSQGKVMDGHLACPFHGFEFDSSGQCVYVPAFGRNGAVPKALRVEGYRTYEAHGYIWIYWGEPEGELVTPQYFDALGQELSYISFHQFWTVHYSRMIENQLDLGHLTFVHYNTIGRGNKTVVDGPIVKLENGLLEVWVSNRVDDGTPRKSTDELPTPTRRPFLQFRYPNIWHNWIADGVRVTVAFVPVDEEHSIMYGRYYQRMPNIPGIKQLVLWIGKKSSEYIANQDRVIVNNQLPKKTGLKIGEKPQPTDKAILTYRQHRQKLLDENNKPA
ncbi:MAG: aromatic ring-hydroxylating dioxygenase subunit alpha [Anaerolineaceae bacterium]|nr:aromatic ring-hydroxylating dioxygenase subunit alpha [Anaerolineaceae bacterium]